MATVKLDDICKNLFGITPRRYRQLASEGILPPVVKGEIDVAKATRALLDYYRKLLQGQGSLTLTDERARLTKIQADRKELQLQKERGELIHVETAMKMWGSVIQQIRQKLLAIPTKASPILHGAKTIAETKETLEKFIFEVLEEITETEPGYSNNKRSNKKHIKHSKATIKASNI